MAEFGKGDPRWIVNEREDGRNVNAWHWYVYQYLYFKVIFINSNIDS